MHVHWRVLLTGGSPMLAHHLACDWSGPLRFFILQLFSPIYWAILLAALPVCAVLAWLLYVYNPHNQDLVRSSVT
jgi:hypothetical protein